MTTRTAARGSARSRQGSRADDPVLTSKITARSVRLDHARRVRQPAEGLLVLCHNGTAPGWYHRSQDAVGRSALALPRPWVLAAIRLGDGRAGPAGDAGAR